MITTEVFINENFKEIYYRNNEDIAIRHLILDLEDNVIQDELSEYSSNGKHINSVVFASDYVTILGYRQYHFDEEGNEIGYSNYKRFDGRLKLIYKAEREDSKDGKVVYNFYNDNNELLYYELFELDPEYGMLQMATYNNQNEEVLGISLPSYTDY